MWRALGAYALTPFNIDSGHVAVGGAGAFVQFLGGVCLALGAFFRPAAALLTLVAAGALAARWKRDVPFVDWAAQAYAGVACVALLLAGPGRFAVRKG